VYIQNATNIVSTFGASAITFSQPTTFNQPSYLIGLCGTRQTVNPQDSLTLGYNLTSGQNFYMDLNSPGSIIMGYNTGQSSNGNGTFQFYGNSSTRTTPIMYIQGQGTYSGFGGVGILNKNPAYALDVSGNAQVLNTLYVAGQSTSISSASGVSTTYIGSSGGGNMNGAFSTVGISNNGYLETTGNITLSSTTSDTFVFVTGYQGTTSGYPSSLTIRDLQNTLTFYVLGNLTATGTCSKPGGGSWTSTSDERVKRDIVDYTEGLNILSQIRPVSFKYNGLGGSEDTGEPQVGVIAQEALQYLPEAVGSVKERDIDGTPVLNFDPSRITWITVNAIKELAAKQALVLTKGLPKLKQAASLSKILQLTPIKDKQGRLCKNEVAKVFPEIDNGSSIDLIPYLVSCIKELKSENEYIVKEAARKHEQQDEKLINQSQKIARILAYLNI